MIFYSQKFRCSYSLFLRAVFPLVRPLTPWPAILDCPDSKLSRPSSFSSWHLDFLTLPRLSALSLLPLTPLWFRFSPSASRHLTPFLILGLFLQNSVRPAAQPIPIPMAPKDGRSFARTLTRSCLYAIFTTFFPAGVFRERPSFFLRFPFPQKKVPAL